MGAPQKEKIWFVKLNKLGLGIYDRSNGRTASFASSDM